MKTSYTIFRADGTVIVGAVDWPPVPSLAQIKALVEPIVGGPIEHCFVLDPAKVNAFEVGRDDYRDLFVDELGHVRADGPKPRNEAATAIYRANWLRAHPGDRPEELDWIAGDAVLFERQVWQ